MRLLTCLLLILAIPSCKQKVNETKKMIRPIKFAKIKKFSGEETHLFSGVTKAENEINLSFKVAGTLSSVNVKLGDRVREGQLIATIDPVDYDIKTKQAVSQKEGSLANVQSARSNAKAAETQLINAQATYDRVVGLYESNSIALSEYEQAKAGLDAAQAQYDAANSQVEAATTQVSSAEQQVLAADNQVNYTRLVSPLDGIITSLQVESNEVVNTGMPIAVVSSLGRPEVEVGIPEVFINKIRKGQKVKITLPSSPLKDYQGMVDQVAYATGNSPTYPVIVKIDNSAELVRPGMAANVIFLFNKKELDTLTTKKIVPIEALGKDAQGNFVFVLNPKTEGVYTIEKKMIVVGKLLSEGFELKNGLAEGELVATAGLKSLMNGTEVRLLKD